MKVVECPTSGITPAVILIEDDDMSKLLGNDWAVVQNTCKSISNLAMNNDASLNIAGVVLLNLEIGSNSALFPLEKLSCVIRELFGS